jgi:hypothetical protein
MSYATVFPKQLQINMSEILSALKQLTCHQKLPGIHRNNTTQHSTVTVNKEMYMDIICRLTDTVRRIQPERRRTNSWFCPSRQSSSTLISFGQGFISNKPM